jgi:hypothetical protein
MTFASGQISPARTSLATNAVNGLLKAGINLDRLITTRALLSADRMARTPVNVDAGWGVLTVELNLAASLRAAMRQGGVHAAAKGLFHAVCQFFSDRWLNIPRKMGTQTYLVNSQAILEKASRHERVVAGR